MTTCSQITLPTEKGILEAFYSKENTKSHLKKLSWTLEDKTSEYAISQIFLNEQPISSIKRSFQMLETSSLIEVRVENEKLKLNLSSTDSFLLSIKHSEKTTLSFTASPILLGGELKRIIQEKWSLSDSDIQIYTNEGDQFDLNSTLKKNGLSNNSTLLVVSKKNHSTSTPNSTSLENGFPLDPLPFVDFKNPQSLSLNPSQQSAFMHFCTIIFKQPKDDFAFLPRSHPAAECVEWRKIIPGLTLLGECNNLSCGCYSQSTQEKVCISLGIATLNKDELLQKSLCPCCKEPATIKNCLFWNCAYTIEGKIEGQSSSSLTGSAPRSGARTFEERNSVNWLTLTIKTTQPNSFCILI